MSWDSAVLPGVGKSISRRKRGQRPLCRCPDGPVDGRVVEARLWSRFEARLVLPRGMFHEQRPQARQDIAVVELGQVAFAIAMTRPDSGNTQNCVVPPMEPPPWPIHFRPSPSITIRQPMP